MSAAAEHTHYAPSTPPHSLGITCRCGRFVPCHSNQHGNRGHLVAIVCTYPRFICSLSGLLTIFLSSVTVLTPWAKTATPTDGKRARRSLRASLPFPQLLPCILAVQLLPVLFLPPPNPEQPCPRESATSTVVDNLASPKIANASFAGSTAEI